MERINHFFEEEKTAIDALESYSLSRFRTLYAYTGDPKKHGQEGFFLDHLPKLMPGKTVLFETGLFNEGLQVLNPHKNPYRICEKDVRSTLTKMRKELEEEPKKCMNFNYYDYYEYFRQGPINRLRRYPLFFTVNPKRLSDGSYYEAKDGEGVYLLCLGGGKTELGFFLYTSGRMIVDYGYTDHNKFFKMPRLGKIYYSNLFSNRVSPAEFRKAVVQGLNELIACYKGALPSPQDIF